VPAPDDGTVDPSTPTEPTIREKWQRIDPLLSALRREAEQFAKAKAGRAICMKAAFKEGATPELIADAAGVSLEKALRILTAATPPFTARLSSGMVLRARREPE